MLTIQQVGLEVLQNTPRSLYIFGGSEYGIKSKYIEILKDHYGGIQECSKFGDISDTMSAKHLIPLKPKLYVVRYDEQFIKDLTPEYARKISKLNIIGTVVLIYEHSTHVNKCDKLLPDNTVTIDKVDTRFIFKYLKGDFPSLPDNILQIVATVSYDYGHAQNICRSLVNVDDAASFNSITPSQVQRFFGIDTSLSEDELKCLIASKNYNALIHVLDECDDVDQLPYTILATMVELEKLHCNTYTESNLRPYVKQWSRKDIYNMFDITYDALNQLRTITSDSKNIMMYLFSMLKFSEIPDKQYLTEVQ